MIGDEPVRIDENAIFEPDAFTSGMKSSTLKLTRC